MAYYPINVAGGSYRHKDLGLTAQRTVNFWPQKQETGQAKSAYTLESFYGLRSYGSAPVQKPHRGSYVHRGIMYSVIGPRLYRVAKGADYTDLGAIEGTKRAIFGSLGETMIIASGGKAYSLQEDTLTVGDDADFENPNTVTVINQKALYDGQDGRYGVSDVGEPLDINGLNYATAESGQGDVLRVYGFNDIAHMMTSVRIEQWWNSGQGNPPFDKVTQGTIEIGLSAIYSVDQDDQGMYFLGDDFQAYYLAGGTPVPLFPQVIVREIGNLPLVDDAVGWTMQIDGQWFYILKFPAGDRTFAYPKGGEWFELSSGLNGGRYIGDGYVFAYGRNLIIDENGNAYTLDEDKYDEGGDTIRRIRTFSPIHSGLMGQNGKDIEISHFNLVGKTGTGVDASGQGSDPEVILQWSEDGVNWSAEQRGHVGKAGNMTQLRFDVNEAHENWIFRIISTDPVYSSWHAAGIEAEVGI